MDFDDDEPIDPRKNLVEERCAPQCEKARREYVACSGRYAKLAEPEDDQSCAPQFHDFVHCVDECVAKSLFKKLK